MSEGASSRHCPLCLRPIHQGETMAINAAPGTFEGRLGYVVICAPCASSNRLRIALAALLGAASILLLMRLMTEGGIHPETPEFFRVIKAAIPGGVGFLLMLLLVSFTVWIIVATTLGHMRFQRMMRRLTNARANRCHADESARRRTVISTVFVTFFAVALAVPILALTMIGKQAFGTNPSGYGKTVYHGSIAVSHGPASWSDVNPGLSALLALVGLGTCVVLVGLGLGVYRAALKPTYEEANRLKAAFPKPPELFRSRKAAKHAAKHAPPLG